MAPGFEYHSMGVHSPLRIADHLGQDTLRDTLLNETLTLTKLNWNSAHFAGSLPITLKFSKLLGEIIRVIPPGRDPLPQFKFYIASSLQLGMVAVSTLLVRLAVEHASSVALLPPLALGDVLVEAGQTLTTACLEVQLRPAFVDCARVRCKETRILRSHGLWPA